MSRKTQASRLLFITLGLSLLIGLTYAQSDNRDIKLFWAEKITDDGKLVFREYDLSSTQTLDITDLEIWSETNRQDPLGFLYWDEEPDFKLKLLEAGLARLKDESSAPDRYIRAQNYATSQRLGMWASLPTATPIPASTSTPLPTNVPRPPPAPTPTPAFVGRLWKTITSLDWIRIGKNVLTVLGGLVGLYGGAEFIGLIRDLWRRRRVPLIMLGRPSTGKSWLWHRLLDPAVTLQELMNVKRSELVKTKVARRTKPMGRYEIVPVFIDTPGGRSGEQLTQLLDRKGVKWLRKILVRQKTVWIIMLATTPDTDAKREHAWEAKIDKAYVEQQLGHLDLPMGVLTSKKTPKPQMVIICIGKFDLFSDHDVQDSSSQKTISDLMELFKRHIARIQIDCKDQGVPCRVVLCSALKGWGTESILRHVERALFER